jgi:HAD superfamily hydrolase (TIGR01459 family)
MSKATASPPAIPILDGIRDLAPTSDAWIVDIWGVMHNGVRPFLDAAEACTRFRASGGTVVLLSNAPRPRGSVAKQLAGIGVPQNAWDQIITSGDATRALIQGYGDRPILHLGPARDQPLFEGLGANFSQPADAEAAVCTGLYDDTTETPDDYRALFETLLARKVPLICANPDLTVQRGNDIVYCAGALAEAYAAMGGPVIFAGKPHLPVYDMTFAEIARLEGRTVAKDRILAIGDGLRTDIAGAAAAGLRAVLIASGIHFDSADAFSETALGEIFADRDDAPIAAMRELKW